MLTPVVPRLDDNEAEIQLSHIGAVKWSSRNISTALQFVHRCFKVRLEGSKCK